MPPMGFEPAFPASERPQTHAADRPATGIGSLFEYTNIKYSLGSRVELLLTLYVEYSLLLTVERISIFNCTYNTFFFVALRPNAGHCLLIFEVSRSHTTTQHSR